MRPTARPETHQNLIYPDKDHGAHPNRGAPTTAAPRMARPNCFLHCDEKHGEGRCPSTPAKARPLQTISSVVGSGALRPQRVEGRALAFTYGDDRVRTDDPLLAKQVLSQLSYAPKNLGGPGRI
jgi:hypothetical protein